MAKFATTCNIENMCSSRALDFLQAGIWKTRGDGLTYLARSSSLFGKLFKSLTLENAEIWIAFSIYRSQSARSLLEGFFRTGLGSWQRLSTGIITQTIGRQLGVCISRNSAERLAVEVKKKRLQIPLQDSADDVCPTLGGGIKLVENAAF